MAYEFPLFSWLNLYQKMGPHIDKMLLFVIYTLFSQAKKTIKVFNLSYILTSFLLAKKVSEVKMAKTIVIRIKFRSEVIKILGP